MGVTIIVGGQYGSEGKGKIAGYLSKEFQMCIRTGGPNAGHTVEYQGKMFKLRCIPCGFVNNQCKLAIGTGAVINLDVLNEEIDKLKLNPKRLFINNNVGIIEERHIRKEAKLRERIGSTAQGVGAALSERISRSTEFRFAKDVAELKPFLGDVAQLANDLIDSGGKVQLECTQGFGLSLYFGNYPFVTSRDTTAGTFCGEAGISPLAVDDIILVIRTYPIRVGGYSGPLLDEITWNDVTKESDSPLPIKEKTTVTKRIRRVGRFDIDLVRRAIRINRPTQIALNFADYINYKDSGKKSFKSLSTKTKNFIAMVEKKTNIQVTLIGTGPSNLDIIDLRV